MKYLYLLTCLFNFNLLEAQSLLNNPNFDTLFIEEFNGNQVDITKWDIANNLLTSPPTTAITAFNEPQNVSVSDGILHLKSTYNNSIVKLSAIESKRIDTIGDFFEIRLKFKNGPQAYSTAWLYSGNGNCSSWADYQEIDILEFFGNVQKTSGGVHYCDYLSNGSSPSNCLDISSCLPLRYNVICNGNQPIPYPASEKISCRNVCNANIHYSINSPEEFHNYCCSWRLSGIKLYQDWSAMNSRPTPTQMIQHNIAKHFVLGIGLRCWCPNQCMADITNYPYTEDVDYVRAFRLNVSTCNEQITSIPNFNTFNYNIKKSITLSNTIIPSLISLSSKGFARFIALYVTDYIELNSNVEVMGGGMFELGIIPCN